MSRLTSRFERFAKRMATDGERARLLAVQKELGLPDDDTMWPLIFALQLYDGYFRQTPRAVRAECKGVIADAAGALRVEMAAAADATASRLSGPVGRLEAGSRALAAVQANFLAAVAFAFAASILLAFIAAWAFHAQGCRTPELSEQATGTAAAARLTGER